MINVSHLCQKCCDISDGQPASEKRCQVEKVRSICVHASSLSRTILEIEGSKGADPLQNLQRAHICSVLLLKRPQPAQYLLPENQWMNTKGRFPKARYSASQINRMTKGEVWQSGEKQSVNRQHTYTYFETTKLANVRLFHGRIKACINVQWADSMGRLTAHSYIVDRQKGKDTRSRM